MNPIQGHQKQIFQLGQAFLADRLPHALLFVGPESIGKKKVARALAQKLICENPPQTADLESCGICPSCLRVTKNQSENLKVIEPDGQNIKIDQTREVIQFLSLANFEHNRVIIIDQTHMMNPQAANALLKILEEPADHVHFILIAPEAESVMSTLRSRSQVIRFSPLSIEELKMIKPAQPEWAYKCSRGQIQTLQALVGEQGSMLRAQSFEILDLFWNDQDFLKANSEWRLLFKDREEAQNIVKNWILIMRDVLILKMEELKNLMNIDQIEKLKKMTFLENQKINQFLSQLLKTEKEIQGYMDSVLLIESLWVKYARN